MSRPLAFFDVSTSTGWATRDAEDQLSSGVQKFELARGESPGMRFLRFRAWVRELLDLAGLVQGSGGVLGFEQAHHRGGHATALCVGLVTVLLEEAAARGLEATPVATGTLKKFATGSGAAGKPEMVAACLARFGPRVSGAELGDDEADALHGLDWLAKRIGEELPC